MIIRSFRRVVVRIRTQTGKKRKKIFRSESFKGHLDALVDLTTTQFRAQRAAFVFPFFNASFNEQYLPLL